MSATTRHLANYASILFGLVAAAAAAMVLFTQG
jgi:hypothetical protein